MSKDTRNQDKHPFGWCQKRKPCHKKKNNNSFDDEKKTTIAETDLGSYYKQSEWWLEEYLDKDSGFESLTSPTNDSVDDYEEIELSWKHKRDGGYYWLHSSFVIMSPSVLQSLLKRGAVWRNCKEDLVIEDSARHALGVLWKLKCTSEHCKSEKKKCFTPVTSKVGHFFEINCWFILAFLGFCCCEKVYNYNEFKCTSNISVLDRACTFCWW